MAYDVKPIQAPRAAGSMLRLMTALVENPLTGSLLAGKLLGDAGILALRRTPAEEALPVEAPVFTDGGVVPTTSSVALDSAPLLATLAAASWPAPPPGSFAFSSAAEFVAAYREGRVTPSEVAQRVIDARQAADARQPPLRTFIAQDAHDVLRQAEAATARYREGRPLGPLDGVPVAVKDEVDQLPYPTTVGTRFLGQSPATADAETVARLRRAGALLIGKANMHEIGLGVTGINPHHGPARNPYDPTRASGGSSSGSAAAVAYGYCPLALGADGGGSIRIPASLCGVVGLKPTFGRVSERGAAPLCWSVAHLGPLAATVRDAALGYALLAGPDPADPNTLHQPAPRLDGIGDGVPAGLRLGIYSPWFEDASPAVVAACRATVQQLVERGAELREIDLPELGMLRTVHLVTIISEMATAHLPYFAEHRREYGLDTRLNLALARRLQAYDYAHAQRLRSRIAGHFARALAQVDVIVTPSTGCTAPPIPDDTLHTGESNLPLIDRIMRFAQAANLTGLPAISVPAGYDEDGLPIGLQLLGRPWQEHLLLRLAATVEGLVVRRAPAVSCQLL